MRILLVEDDNDGGEILRRGLVSQHYSVDLARDGEEGLDYALTNDYDLLILDVMLPKMDGRTLCKTLRQQKVMTPILMLTALGSSEEVIQGLDLGADDYIVKPFNFGVLLARVRSLTRRGSEQRTAEIQIGDLVIDTARRSVTRAGKAISLTSKEFALLEYLAINCEKVVTRDAIAEHVWDENFDPKSNVIESLMSCLRQSLDRGYDVALIHTVRGAGYRLSAGA